MKNRKLTLTTVGMAAFVAGSFLPVISHAAADAEQSACYQAEGFINTFRLDVNRQDQPVGGTATSTPNGVEQTAYRVQGKLVSGSRLSNTGGTIIVGVPPFTVSPDSPSGSHLHLHTQPLRGSDDNVTGVPVKLDCTSGEVMAAPETWKCYVRNDSGTIYSNVVLAKVNDPPSNPNCTAPQEAAADTQRTLEPGQKDFTLARKTRLSQSAPRNNVSAVR
ncbi:MAG: hypothetical protein PHE55_05225 [Methylococcaceae bacterium]|nr:hypothetical protein [Methylococcaceae bacterium]